MEIPWSEIVHVVCMLLGSIITLSGSALGLSAHVEMLVLFGTKKLPNLPGYYAIQFNHAAGVALIGSILSLLNILLFAVFNEHILQVVAITPVVGIGLMQGIVIGILLYAWYKAQPMHDKGYDRDNTIFYHALSGNIPISTVFYLASAGQVIAGMWLLTDIVTFVVSIVH